MRKYLDNDVTLGIGFDPIRGVNARVIATPVYHAKYEAF